MKTNFKCFGFILHAFPVSSKLTPFMEMDCISKAVCLCFLTVKTAQILREKIPFLSGTNFFRLVGFTRSSQRETSIATVKCATKHTFGQCDPIKKIVMGKKKNICLSETSPKKKFKIEEKKLIKDEKKRPNYFVAVQISNPDIHEAIKRIQDHIIAQNIQFNACMNSIKTFHITLMVMSITDSETHDRALKALRNVHEECNDDMSKNPLKLEFCGLGHFKNRVLYAKIKENESLERLSKLAQCVRKHFADFEIYSTDQREFNPHLTIAKIDFLKKKHKVLKKIEPSLYTNFINENIGCETIIGIQLLKMTGPKNEAGYYIGENLIFESNISGSSREESSLVELKEKKRDIRTKIANLAQKIFK